MEFSFFGLMVGGLACMAVGVLCVIAVQLHDDEGPK